jgi:hypothetical protein
MVLCHLGNSIMKKQVLSSTIALALGLGAAGDSVAGIYAGSRLLASDLSIQFTPQNPGTNPVIAAYSFTTNSTAGVTPGTGDASIANCSGNLTGPTTTCGTGGAGTPVLYTGFAGNTTIGNGPADVNGGRTPLRSVPLGSAPYLGPGLGNTDYASADAIIDTSELVSSGTQATATRQISETEISAGATNAQAGSQLSSTTSLTYSITLPSTGEISITFNANVDLLSQFSDSAASDATSNASTDVQFRLSGPSGFTWSPSAITAGACTSNITGLSGGANCTSEVVSENLNNSVTAPGPLPNSSDSYSRGLSDLGLQPYSLVIAGLQSGSYSLSLNFTTAADVTRTAAIPVPSTLLLLSAGLGLFAAALARRGDRRAA